MKWCSLPYEDATWELNEDVDEGKVEEFRKIQNRQPRLKRTVGNWGFLTEGIFYAPSVFSIKLAPGLHLVPPLPSIEKKCMTLRGAESTSVCAKAWCFKIDIVV